MIFSQYKESALGMLAISLDGNQPKTTAFDIVLEHLNHVAAYYTNESSHVSYADDRLDTLQSRLDAIE